MSTRVVVVGGSGFGREALDVLEAMQRAGVDVDIVGVVDDGPTRTTVERLRARRMPYIGSVDAWLQNAPIGDQYVLGIGQPDVRRRLVVRLDDAERKAFTAIHPAATFGSACTLLDGAVVCAGAVVSTNVHLGRHVHLNANATIGHDAVLEDFVSINPGAVISGEVVVQAGSLVGAGAVVLQGLTVGRGSLVGAAACVTRSVPLRVTAVGVPARW